MTKAHAPFIAILGSTGLISLSLQHKFLSCTTSNILLLSTRTPSVLDHPRIFSCPLDDICSPLQPLRAYPVSCLILLSWQGTPRSMPPPSTTNSLLLKYHSCIQALNPDRVFFLSTAGCLYPHLHSPSNESTKPLPANEYAVQKLRFEKYLSSLCSSYSIPFCSLRISTVFGPLPHQSSLGLINTWSHNLFGSKPLTVYNTPTSTLNLIDVATLSEVIVKLLKLPNLPGIINICHPDHITISQIIEIFSLYHSYSPKFSYVEPLIPRVITLDSSLLRSLLVDFNFPELKTQISRCIEDVRSYYP